MKLPPAVIEVHAPVFRKLPHPGGGPTTTYEFATPVKELPVGDLQKWKEVNPRDVKRKGPVYESIKETLRETPENFLDMNRGLTLSVASVEWDEKTKKAKIKLNDPTLHGLLDGGHTTAAAEEAQQNADEFTDLEDAWVTIRLKTGVPAELIAKVAGGLNTSLQVDLKSILKLEGHFKEMQDVLKKANAPYADKIAFKMNEVYPSDYAIEELRGQPKTIDIKEILYYLAPFDVPKWKDRHPTEIFGRKEELLRQFDREMQDDPKAEYAFSALITRMDDILKLRDLVDLALVPYLGKLNTGTQKKGKKVKSPNRKRDFVFINAGVKVGALALGHLMPALGAFRANVAWDKPKGSFSWKVDNEELLERVKGRLAETVKEIHMDLAGSHPEYVGRSKVAWSLCYERVAMEIEKMT